MGELAGLKCVPFGDRIMDKTVMHPDDKGGL
jgi:hypothetical protein